MLQVHTSDYIDRFEDGRLSDKEIRAIGFPWSESVVRRNFASVGGTLAAAKALLTQPELRMAAHISGVRAPLPLLPCHWMMSVWGCFGLSRAIHTDAAPIRDPFIGLWCFGYMSRGTNVGIIHSILSHAEQGLSYFCMRACCPT